MSVALTVPERSSRVVAADLEIDILGECTHPSPLQDRLAQSTIHYVGKADRVLLRDRLSQVLEHHDDLENAPAFELAGPRHQLFFEPKRLRCGIVTCGGLCPGLNNVIRGIVLELTQSYGVAQILGFRYGYEGIVRRHGHGAVRLTPMVVSDVHHQGGTMLGTSRGAQDPREVVDRLEELEHRCAVRRRRRRHVRGRHDAGRGNQAPRLVRSVSSAFRRRSTTTFTSSIVASASKPRFRLRST